MNDSHPIFEALRRVEKLEEDFRVAALCVAYKWAGRVEYEARLEDLLDELIDSADALTEELSHDR
jgi:hypothetical protein